jgi:hypothetical protein
MNAPVPAARDLDLGGRCVGSTLVAGSYPVSDTAIVVNLAPSPLRVDEEPPTTIAPFASTVLVDTALSDAGSALLLRPAPDVTDIVREPGWALLADVLPGFPGDVPLWRGPQRDAGTAVVDLGSMLGNGSPRGEPVELAVRLNLWFAPAGTDCVIHNEHAFVEIHTQVHGTGRMQKFRSPDPGTRYEDIVLASGATHAPFGSTTPDGLVHPWHQYRAETDCVWLAVEYHHV